MKHAVDSVPAFPAQAPKLSVDSLIEAYSFDRGIRVSLSPRLKVVRSRLAISALTSDKNLQTLLARIVRQLVSSVYHPIRSCWLLVELWW